MFKKILIFIFCIEFISLTLLFILRIYNLAYFKISNIEPLVVYFSKNHLPHPILRKSKLNSNGTDLFDPNTVLYSHRFNRFGEEKKINLDVKNEEHFNIFLIGGSSAEGDGVNSSDHTIDSIIKKEIKSLNCSNSINVYNEAVSGNSSKQDFLNISLRIIPHYKPDMIISLQGWNDFLGYVGSRNNGISPLAKYWSTREQKMYNYINQLNIKFEVIDIVKTKTFLGILLSSMFGTYEKYYYIDLNSKAELSKTEDIEILKKNYFYFQEMSYEVSKSNNIKYYHFFQPLLINKSFPSEYEKNILNGKKNTFSHSNRNNIIYSSQYWDNLQKFYQGIITEKKFEEKKWIINFSNIFKVSTDTDFIDHGHYSKIAQNKIGTLIFNKIKDKIHCN